MSFHPYSWPRKKKLPASPTNVGRQRAAGRAKQRSVPREAGNDA